MKYWLSLLSLSFFINVQAHEWNGGRPDGHAPIGVMGEHTHKQGEWMLSYRYMHMQMEGNRTGTNSVSDAEVLNDYMVTPTDMDMGMHMLGVMYAPSNKLTLMAMLPYVKNSMNHLTRMSVRFKTEASGLGDIGLSGLLKVYDQTNHRVHLNIGFTLPTGSIDEKADTPAGSNQQLPYPMQLGSGTYDFVPGITYLGQGLDWSWGAQALATVRLGENDNSYTLGNRLNITGWLARKFSSAVSGSLRLDARDWDNIDGADPSLNPMMVPTADPNLRGGTRVDLLMGLNWYAKAGSLAGNRLAIEAGIPVYQKLDGPQLETDLIFTLGWQYAF